MSELSERLRASALEVRRGHLWALEARIMSEAANALEAQAARIAELEAENERLGKALADAKAQIMAADACANRHNAAGHLTDRALWSDRAISTIDAALGGSHD